MSLESRKAGETGSCLQRSDAMTLTPHQSLGSYSPELLDSLDEAFTVVWMTLYAHIPIAGNPGV